MDPEQHPAELAREALGVGRIQECRVVVKLPRSDSVRRDIHERDGQRIDDQRQKSRDGDVRAGGDRKKRGDEGVHDGNDHRDEQAHGHSARDRTAIEPPQGWMAQMRSKRPEQPIFMNRLASRNVARDPLEAASRRTGLSHCS